MAAPADEKVNQRPLAVHTLSARSTHGYVSLGERRYRCAIGRGGKRALKREGDGASPIGCWRIRRLMYRSDKVVRPRTGLPIRPITAEDGWCDAPSDRNYNRPVRLPYPASTETMRRDDHLYDLVLILDHNERPRRRGCGSAIFIHLARADYEPTAGCIALKARDLRCLLVQIDTRTRIVIR